VLRIISDLWQISKKDLLEFSRDRLRLLTFIIMPIFMMMLVGFIFPNQNSLKNVPLGVANQDNGELSQKLEQTFSELKLAENQQTFEIKKYADLDQLKEAIKKQEVAGALFIPTLFSESIAQNKQAEVIIVEDQANPQIGQMVSQVLSKVVEGFGKGISTKKVSLLSKDLSLAETIVAPIRAKIEGIVPGNPNYFEFVAPGIIAMIVMTAVLTGLAASIAREKEQGTLDGILISPVNRLSIILGKAFSQAIRGLIQGAIVLLLAFVLFGVRVHGSYLLVISLLLLGIFSFVGLGILVSAIAAEQETATQLLFMFQFPMLFLSGVFFPILLMPPIMQKIAYAIPLTYAINALRKVMVLGAGFAAVKIEILVLLIFGAITLAISVPVFKRIITK